MGSSAYYVLSLKLAYATVQLPNSTIGTPRPLQPLTEYRFTIQDNTVWQQILSFKVTDATISPTTATINTLQVNDQTLNPNKTTAWDTNSSTYTYRLFIELWLYNQPTGTVEFNNRYVSLFLNLTKTP